MPQLIEVGFDMKLTMPSSNKTETALFLASHPQEFILPGFVIPAGYRLVTKLHTPTADGVMQTVCFIYTGGDVPEMVYKVKLIIRNEPNAYLPIKNCTQLLVWRQVAGPHSFVLSGFARQVFQYLLQSNNIMISDEQQTPDGKRFWLDRMGEAFSIADVSVYYIDLDELDKELSPIVVRIQSFEDLMEKYVPNGWGADEAHKNRVFLISTKKLI
ncbi:hypothetical protein VII00023_00320 [Vibrio ichthyoenteri ATCC 700023]|uniref:Uncharacterized protein n=1 Tax=Vibrio ichthyoenteri ATCC 700023 TaxID=870968 RepID=F9RZ97_9VIBR|nr:hypothetical protein [Vibrio ichthyoenteri]EGU45686.1 hypothetical protein VII00023_00320 [Vibrio ichthyoenteri ATCC 700023]